MRNRFTQGRNYIAGEARFVFPYKWYSTRNALEGLGSEPNYFDNIPNCVSTNTK